jgi:hypothetical protein
VKPKPKVSVAPAIPWTGGSALENDRAPNLAAEKMKDVIGGRNLPGPPDKVAKGKRVRIPRSNQR